MSRGRGFWTCQRVTRGVKCGSKNANRFQLCQTCGRRRPPRAKPKHMQALALSYDEYVVLNGGEHCGICRRTREQLPDPSRKLDRDHCHGGRGARGLLCRKCNRNLKQWMEPWWLRAAAAYLERSEAS